MIELSACFVLIIAAFALGIWAHVLTDSLLRTRGRERWKYVSWLMLTLGVTAPGYTLLCRVLPYTGGVLLSICAAIWITLMIVNTWNFWRKTKTQPKIYPIREL